MAVAAKVAGNTASLQGQFGHFNFMLVYRNLQEMNSLAAPA